jgi:probable HAF family extracellular repeat protein
MIQLDFEGIPYAINNRGEFVGKMYASGHPFLWSDGTTIDLGSLGGELGSATGINDQTQVVGQSFPTEGPPQAFLWTADRGMRSLGSFDGHSISGADAINNRGQIVGDSYSDQLHTSHAAYFSRDGVIDLGTLGTFSTAHALNNEGQVVGMCFTSLGTRAFITDLNGGPMLDLNDVIPPGTGWSLFDARGINDAGQIVGTGQLPGYDVIHAFLLTPDSTPSVAELASVGVTPAGSTATPPTPFVDERPADGTATPITAEAYDRSITSSPVDSATRSLSVLLNLVGAHSPREEFLDPFGEVLLP